MSLDQTPINQLITDNIDTWTSTVKTKATTGRGSSKKLELYGVKKLRELILELAVRGKLVPQDPNDEPASVLLERIAAQKAQLIKDKKIKKNRKQPVITQEEIYFSAPKSWAYARLEDVYDVRDGTHDSPKPTSEGYPLVTSKNLSSGKLDLSEVKLISKEDHMKVIERSRVDRNDILFAMIGSIGNPVIVDTEIEFSIKNVGLFKYYNPKDSSPNYLNHFLKYAAEIMKKQSAGGVQPFVSLGKLRGFVMPTPPLAEQHRIVAKVNELMTLCDQLEQQTEASIEAHQVLVTTLLDTLTNSANAEELMQNWQLVAEHFDTLFTTEESIDQLKQTILQLAVMGKLVPQDPNDEPAAKLLERIAEEKAQLVKEKKIKKHPSVEPIGHVGVIPSSWKEIVVQDFADIRLGSTPSRHESKFWNGDIPWVSSGEVANGVIVDTAEKITQVGFDNSSTSIIPKRSLLMAIIGQGKTRGQTALLGIDACTNQNVAAFVFNEELVIPEYVWLWAQSKYESHRQGGHGGAQPALNGKKVRSFAFPLPPTNEQMRIVAKVNALNLLCDQLKQRLRTSQQTQLQLTDAIVEQAL
ncbi:restriction endonuclease subunit S [Vibrio sinaloensis]|uniref:restriction endonuclease subunit S n=1 Tax=Photobacterium sp. (strain ATCC 43367) TaxID=379097 RepID=UPI00057E29B4|nr:hypothetical protein RJ47_08525 [Vibrio sinaloensis]